MDNDILLFLIALYAAVAVYSVIHTLAPARYCLAGAVRGYYRYSPHGMSTWLFAWLIICIYGLLFVSALVWPWVMWVEKRQFFHKHSKFGVMKASILGVKRANER